MSVAVSFSRRIALYFGVLFLANVASVLLLWYLGFPFLGLQGAAEQRLQAATRLLEVSANQRVDTIKAAIAERRGDALVLAENKLLPDYLADGNGPETQKHLERVFTRLQRAYPDVYQSLRLVDPIDGRVLASSDVQELGQVFPGSELLAQSRATGATELVEEIGVGAERTLAIVRQVQRMDEAGYPNSGLLGILILTLRMEHLLGLEDAIASDGDERVVRSIILGSDGSAISPRPGGSPEWQAIPLTTQVARGFEGTLQLTDARGEAYLAVYRHVGLDTTKGWTLIHFQKADDALRGLWGQIRAALLVGVLLTVVALLIISVSSRHLTRPLRRLAHVARSLGRGDWTVRDVPDDKDSREFRAVSAAFNAMADQVANAQQVLEAQVQARTHELSVNEERLRLAAMAGNLGIYDLDLRSGKASVNDQYASMLGYEPRSFEESNEAWMARLHPDDHDRVVETYRRYVEGELGEYEVEFRQRKRDGDWVWILSKGRVIERDAQGKPLRMLGTHAEITDRKAAEARLQLAADVFRHAREGILITDASGHMIDVNDTFTSITGYERHEALGRSPRELLDAGRQSADVYAQLMTALQDVGSWSGELWSKRKNGEVFAQLITISAVYGKDGRVQNFVALFSDISALKAHQMQLEHIAHFDALTGLPNRVLLADRLHQSIAQCQRHNQVLGVAFLDLDGFKSVNDLHGHDVGDQLLVAVSRRLKASLREGDTLARLGGDEFVAVLAGLESAQDHEPVLQRLLYAASEPVTVGTTELRVSASIGVTLYPQDNADAEVLLRHADQAMYLAKIAGKNQYRLFDIEHDTAIKQQRESLSDIRHALDAGQFVLHYQPKVNMRSAEVIGVEALIRWQHPERGLLAPGMFLHLIEDHPLSIAVGEWVIATALQQLADWQAVGLTLPISVNIGARQLQHAGFVDRLRELLNAQPSVDPQHLGLEVLETSALQDIDRVSAVMRSCQLLGVHFALDDFGTGYSSLTYLKRLPAAQIKIDQSFVRDMLNDSDDLAIVEGVIGLAKAFGRSVIAEGVETTAHGQQLIALGCSLAQGYGIARPMPAHEVPGWVLAWQPPAAWRGPSEREAKAQAQAVRI